MVAVLFISFVVCLALGMPVAFSLGVSSLLYLSARTCPSTCLHRDSLQDLTLSPCCVSPASCSQVL